MNVLRYIFAGGLLAVAAALAFVLVMALGSLVTGGSIGVFEALLVALVLVPVASGLAWLALRTWPHRPVNSH